MNESVEDFMGPIERVTNPRDAFTQEVRAAYKHYKSVITPEQRQVIENWCRTCPAPCSYGVMYSSNRQHVILGIYSPDKRISDFCWVPFGTDSTTDDIQRFIQRLAVVEIHGG